MRGLLCFLTGLFLTLPLWGGSFQAPSIGGRATGMAGAYTAVVDDPLALYWNPAGLGLIKKKTVTLGTTAVKGYASYETSKFFWIPEGEIEKNKVPWAYIPHFASAVPVKYGMVLGVGSFTPYGLKQIWRDDSYYKFNSVRSEIWLNTIQIGVGGKWRENFYWGVSLGDGVSRLAAKQRVVEIISSPPFLVPAWAKISAESRGFYGTLGFLWKPRDKFTLGLCWRSPSKHYFKGEVDFSPAQGDSFERKMKMKFTFPQVYSLGMAYRGIPRWLISLQVDWTNWEEMGTLVQHLYKEVFLFGMTSPQDVVRIKRDWKNTYTLHLGGEYKINDKWFLRLGYMLDPSPVPEETLDPLMFDVTVDRYSIGLGYRGENWAVDLAYMYSQGRKREVEDSENLFPTNGTYKGYSQVVDLTFNLFF